MQDAFLAKLNPQGTALVYATYLAGAPYNDGSGLAIAVDNAGDAYITGGVSGSNFPATTVPSRRPTTVSARMPL